MNQARSRVIDRVRFEQRKKRVPPEGVTVEESPIEFRDVVESGQQREALTPLIESFAFWPTDVVRPSAALQARLADRLAAETGERVMPSGPQWSEPPWENVAPGIWVKLLANDSDRDVVSMLVRLEPGAEYPPHTHAGTEELYLLDGELWINERKLYPGDYSHAVAGTGDKRVWSETGCTCVLMTSTRDRLA